MLVHKANQPGSTFGSQRQTLLVAIIKGIHFFFDDIGAGTHQAAEQTGAFQYRQANFLIAIVAQHTPSPIFDRTKACFFFREQILHSSDGFDHISHCRLPLSWTLIEGFRRLRPQFFRQPGAGSSPRGHRLSSHWSLFGSARHRDRSNCWGLPP